MRVRGINWRGLVVVASMFMFGGCARQYVVQLPTDELIEFIGRRQQADRYRLAALECVLERNLTADQSRRFGAQLAEIVASRRHSPHIRLQAVRIIADRYRDDAGRWLSGAVSTADERELRRQLLRKLIDLRDQVSLPGLIVALVEIKPSENLPESDVGRAIRAITAVPLATALADQFAANPSARTAVAATICLARHLGDRQACRVLLALPGRDTSIRQPSCDTLKQLRFWARRYDYLPDNFSCFSMSRLLLHQFSAEQLGRLQRRYELLRDCTGYRFEIHDAHTLLNSGDGALDCRRDELAVAIAELLAGREHTKRPASYPGGPDDYCEEFASGCNLLSYTDLLRIRLLLAALDRRATQYRLSRFLRQDLAETDTEVGGLCFLRDDDVEVEFVAYRPGQRKGDNQYIESVAMTVAASDCLARWHCHADRSRGVKLAGPGSDDIHYAAYLGCVVVVVTYVNDRVFNVDYLTPGGVVIDLGNYAFLE